VVGRVAGLLDSTYVSPELGKRMSDSLRARLARGAYDRYPNGPGLSIRINADLDEIARDHHLRLQYSVRPAPRAAGKASTAPSPEDVAQARRELDENNCGFRKAEQFDGNIGFLRLDEFADPALCGSTAEAAMNFLAGSRALIIDLRENGGGKPGMVALVASYLFDRRTHLNDLWTRHTDSTQEFWTRDSVAGRRFGGDKPVYVLTSARTFSAAEELAYDLQALKRATIVGETTAGGAIRRLKAASTTTSYSWSRGERRSTRSRAPIGRGWASSRTSRCPRAKPWIQRGSCSAGRGQPCLEDFVRHPPRLNVGELPRTPRSHRLHAYRRPTAIRSSALALSSSKPFTPVPGILSRTSFLTTVTMPPRRTCISAHGS
jgi:hypothetical protein